MKPSNLWWTSFLLMALGLGLAVGLMVGWFASAREAGWVDALYVVAGFGFCSVLVSVTLSVLALLAPRQEQKPAGGDGRPQPGGGA